MKMRNGFVSNSSSSSFILYGYQIESNNEFWDKLKELVTTGGSESICEEDDDHYELIQGLMTKYPELSYNFGYDTKEEVCIGYEIVEWDYTDVMSVEEFNKKYTVAINDGGKLKAIAETLGLMDDPVMVLGYIPN
jgi:hypothetical protein